MAASLKIGDKTVYPAHGVGEVTAIEKQTIAGIEQTFYVLRILANGMTVLVPTNNVRQVGLRDVIGKDQVSRVLDLLREQQVGPATGTWNRRYREYIEKLKTGSIFEVAKVFRDLRMSSCRKELSFGERKLLDTSRSLLLGELACAENRLPEDIDARLEELFPAKLAATMAPAAA